MQSAFCFRENHGGVFVREKMSFTQILAQDNTRMRNQIFWEFRTVGHWPDGKGSLFCMGPHSGIFSWMGRCMYL